MKEITVTANTLDGLRKAIERIAAKISAPSNLLQSSRRRALPCLITLKREK